MGFQIIPPNTKIDFVKYTNIACIIFIAILAVGALSLIIKGGPNLGVDFAGGVTVQVKFEGEVDPSDLRAALEPLNLPGLLVQDYDIQDKGQYVIRAGSTDDQIGLRNAIENALKNAFPDRKFSIERVDVVGPKVGEDLKGKALEAMFYSILLIAIYISGRFEQRWMAAGMMAAGLALGVYILKLFNVPTGWLIIGAIILVVFLCWALGLRFALGAVVCDIHDVFFVVGIFSILDIEFDLTLVAAMLTVLGYSLNDTIIVFDRIRENMRGEPKGTSLEAIINMSINQTLSRTILTGGTTLLVTFSLFFLGGGALHDFALAMILGVIIGTASSMFVATKMLMISDSRFFSGLLPKPESSTA